MAHYPNGFWGNFGADMNQTTMNAVDVVSSPAGPNVGLMYMPDPWPDVESTIYLHPVMYDNPANAASPWQSWYADQDGRGSGNCTGVPLAIMVPFAERHEGVTQASDPSNPANDSHWGITERWYQKNDFEQNLEKIYRQTARKSDVRRAAYTEFERVHLDGTYDAMHGAFDSGEYARFRAIIGCDFDFQPKPGDP